MNSISKTASSHSRPPKSSGSTRGGGEIGFAGPAPRLAALAVDASIIAGFISLTAAFAEAFGITGNVIETMSWDTLGQTIQWGWLTLVLGASMSFFCAFEASTWKATPGKRLLGLRVTDLKGRRLGVLSVVYRFCLASSSLLLLGMPYVTAFSSRKHQALHDVITRSLVIRKMNHRLDLADLLRSKLATIKGGIQGFTLVQMLHPVPAVSLTLALITGVWALSSFAGGTGLPSPIKTLMSWAEGRLGPTEVFASEDTVALKKPALNAMSLAAPLLKNISQYQGQNGRLPARLSTPSTALIAQDGAVPTSGIEQINYDGQTGFLSFRLVVSENARGSGRNASAFAVSSQVNGGGDANRRATILFRPSFKDGQISSWGCGADGLSQAERPETCAAVVAL